MFKHLAAAGSDSGDMQNVYNCFLLLGILLTQILLSLCAVEDLVKLAAQEAHMLELQMKEGLSMNDKKIIDRKRD